MITETSETPYSMNSIRESKDATVRPQRNMATENLALCRSIHHETMALRDERNPTSNTENGSPESYYRDIESSLSSLRLGKAELSVSAKVNAQESEAYKKTESPPTSTAPIDFDDELGFHDPLFVKKQVSFHFKHAMAAWEKQEYNIQEECLNALIALPGPHVLGATVDKACLLLDRGLPKETYELLQGFKYDPETAPNINMAAYYVRAVSQSFMGHLSPALLDCRRGLALYHKVPDTTKEEQKIVWVGLALARFASQICSKTGTAAEGRFHDSVAAEITETAINSTITYRDLYPKILWTLPVPESSQNDANLQLETAIDNFGQDLPIVVQSELENPEFREEKFSFDTRRRNHFLNDFGLELIRKGNIARLQLIPKNTSFWISEPPDHELRLLRLYGKQVMELIYAVLTDDNSSPEDIDLLKFICSLPEVCNIRLQESTMKKKVLDELATAFYNLTEKSLAIPRPATAIQLIICFLAYGTANALDESNELQVLANALVTTLLNNGADVHIDTIDGSGRYTALSIAALTGRVSLMNTLLSFGAAYDPGVFEPGVYSPVYAFIIGAGDKGDLRALQLLKNTGASLIDPGERGINNLHNISLYGRSGVVLDYFLQRWPKDQLQVAVILDLKGGYTKIPTHRPLTPYEIAGILEKPALLTVFQRHGIYS